MLEKAFIVVQSDEDSERKEESCRESLNLLREYLNNHEQNAGRNMDGKGHSDEVLDADEQPVIGIWRKSDPCCKVPKNFPELCLYFTLLWKVEFCEQ